MGLPKPLLKIQGSYILEWKLEQLQRLGACNRLVVFGYHEARIRNAVKFEKFPETTVLSNPQPDAGQTSSLQVALEAVELSQYLLMQTVDQPPLPDCLIEKILSNSGQNNLLIPVYCGRRGHPPLFPRWFVREIIALPADRGVNSLYKKYADRINHLELDDERLILDLDRPVDFYAYLEKFNLTID